MLSKQRRAAKAQFEESNKELPRLVVLIREVKEGRPQVWECTILQVQPKCLDGKMQLRVIG